MTPAIELNEFLIAVRIPLWAAGHGYAFVEFSRRHGDFAIVSAAALLEADKAGKITRASVTIGGVGVAPVRARRSSRASSARSPKDRMFRELCETLPQDRRHRRHPRARRLSPHLAAVLSRRALEKAVRARDGASPCPRRSSRPG